MKEKLLERLKFMDQAIQDQHQKLQQANADLNMLNGCRQELVHVINMCDAPAEDLVKANEIEAKPPCDDVNCEVV